MPYVEFHLVWTGITPAERALQERSRTIDDYYWSYRGADGLLFSALFYPSAIEICRYNFGRTLFDFATRDEPFEVVGPALREFINFAHNCQAIVSEGHLRDADWLIPFQRNDATVLRRDLWQRADPNRELGVNLPNIGLYHFVGDQTPDWLRIGRDFIREQDAFATLAERKLAAGLDVVITSQDI